MKIKPDKVCILVAMYNNVSMCQENYRDGRQCVGQFKALRLLETVLIGAAALVLELFEH